MTKSCPLDLYFKIQWFCLISWRLFDVCTSYFGSMNQHDPTFDLKINVGHCTVTYISWSSDLPYILKTIWCMNILIWDYESVWPDIWPQNKCRSLWSIFLGPVILRYILKTIWFGIMGQYNPTFDLKINVGLCDLYFMAHWFCLISPRVFDAWVSYFQIFTVWPKLWSQS